MGWPQITWLVLMAIGLGMELSKDGQPRTGKHNFPVTAVASFLAAGLLYAGGFFG